MIKSFADKKTAALWNGERVRQLEAFRVQALRRLDVLHVAKRLEDLRLIPGNRLESLGGDRKGQYSIRINGQWRVCFRWEVKTAEGAKGTPGDAVDVEITDYHRG